MIQYSTMFDLWQDRAAHYGFPLHRNALHLRRNSFLYHSGALSDLDRAFTDVVSRRRLAHGQASANERQCKGRATPTFTESSLLWVVKLRAAKTGLSTVRHRFDLRPRYSTGSTMLESVKAANQARVSKCASASLRRFQEPLE